MRSKTQVIVHNLACMRSKTQVIAHISCTVMLVNTYTCTYTHTHIYGYMVNYYMGSMFLGQANCVFTFFFCSYFSSHDLLQGLKGPQSKFGCRKTLLQHQDCALVLSVPCTSILTVLLCKFIIIITCTQILCGNA